MASTSLPSDSGQILQLLAHDLPQKRTLTWEAHVLEIATAANSGERAGRFDPQPRSLEDLDNIGTPEPCRFLGDRDADSFTGKRVAHEYDPPIEPGDEVTSVGDRSNRHLMDVTDHVEPSGARDRGGRRRVRAGPGGLVPSWKTATGRPRW